MVKAAISGIFFARECIHMLRLAGEMKNEQHTSGIRTLQEGVHRCQNSLFAPVASRQGLRIPKTASSVMNALPILDPRMAFYFPLQVYSEQDKKQHCRKIAITEHLIECNATEIFYFYNIGESLVLALFFNKKSKNMELEQPVYM